MVSNNVIIDLSNVAHILRHSKFKKNKNVYDSTLLFYSIIESVMYSAKKFKSDGIMIACDAKNVWRKDILPSYKGNRDGNRDEYYESTVEVILSVATFFEEYTDITVLKVDRSEADDVISVACQTNKHANVIVSSDKDFIQLIDHKTHLFNPPKNDYRKSDNKDYDLFLKLVRGDSGDGVPSAIPSIRETAVRIAFDDKDEFANLMESVNKRGNKVKDELQRNNTLINLKMQPDYIRDSIEEALANSNQENYNFTRTRQYLAEIGFSEVMDKFDFDAMKLPYKYERSDF